MIKIEFEFDGKSKLDINKDALLHIEAIAKKCFEHLKLNGSVLVNVTFNGDEQMQKLNNQVFEKDYATDVLSFPYIDKIDEFNSVNFPYDYDKQHDAVSVGDIVINLDAMLRQSMQYQTKERELSYLFVHGLLHLFGYDHIDDSDKQVMRKAEEELLRCFV